MKKTLTLITIIALLFSLIGCNSDNAPQTGSITVSIKDSVSRTITSDVSPVAVKYVVKGTAPDGTKVSFDLSESSPSWVKAEAAPGGWSFTVTAYNKDEKAIGSGTASATVIPGQSTYVPIEVYEYSGKGTLTINLAGITTDLVTYTATVYQVVKGRLSFVTSGELTDGSITFTLSNGFYSLFLYCDNSSMVMPAAEAVRIMKDDNLSASYSICDQGGVNVVISNGIKPYPEMSVTLGKTSVAVGEEVTATATIQEKDSDGNIIQGSYSYEWYVNNVKLESADENEVTISFDSAGLYNITCIAGNAETGVVWSEVVKANVTGSQKNTVLFYSGNRLIESRTYTPDSIQAFPTIELGEGFTLSGWKAEGSNELITDESFSLPYSENEYKFYAYIDTNLLRLDEAGAVYGTDVLKNSSTITEVVIPDSIRGKAVTYIGHMAFYNFSKLTIIDIPDSATSIGDSAFCYCSSLTGITIPDGVASIGKSVFSSCTSLTSITIPDSITSIGNSAFWKCSSLTGITIPDSVTSIGDSAFSYCSSLTSITVSENNKQFKSINGVLFDKDAETLIAYPGGHGMEYVIPDSVTSIGNDAFCGCSSLTSVTIPDSVTSIGDFAFSGCSSLTSITIPDDVTSIGKAAYQHCSNLTNVSIPNSVTSIENGTFQDCYSLIEITIPDSVTSIGDFAFDGCWGLTGIAIPDSVTSIGDSAFCYCSSLTGITIPDGVASIGKSVFSSCTSLTSITVSDNNKQFKSIDGVLFDKDAEALIAYPGGHGMEYVIPNSVTSIGNYAFRYCFLTSVTIPDSVTSIGDATFYGCSNLTGINIPDSVTSIGQHAFSSCSSLKKITIPKSVTSIGNQAFWQCNSLTSINIKQDQETTNLTGAPWGAPNATITWNYTD